MLADRLEDAVGAASRAVRRPREWSERGYEAWAPRLLGEIAVRRDPSDVETAEGHYHAALQLAEELGMRPLAPRCHLGLGRLYRRHDKRQEAQEHFGHATTMFRAMAMRFWAGKMEAGLRELG